MESGAAVFATTYSDMQTAADKCEEMEEGYAQCSQFLYGEKKTSCVTLQDQLFELEDPSEAQRSKETLKVLKGVQKKPQGILRSVIS